MNNDTTELYGNAYLEPSAPASPENQQSILEGFGDDYQRVFDACAAGKIDLTAEMTNEEFHVTCKAWLRANPAE